MDNLTVNCSANVIQYMHYLPFGEDWVDQRNSSWNTPYTFSGKEKDVETGYGYFGARYYDSSLSIWLSVDPMSDKYPHQTNYVYCSNNPVMIIDPNGEDEYFNEFGKYLGSDNSTTSNKNKIISQYNWDAAKQTQKIGNKSIDFISESNGKEMSILPSDAHLTEQAQLNIYKHYNNTGLPLVSNKADDGTKIGMVTHAVSENSEKFKPTKIKINLLSNSKAKIIDNPDDIINIFVHEKQHVDDYKSGKINLRNYTNKQPADCRAIETQKNHSSYSRISDFLRNSIDDYSIKNGCN
jgi:RHS repeat-associated protein